jgi:hypothetical protein
MLLAFAIQSIVTQTHVHLSRLSDAGLALQAGKSLLGHDNAPLKQNNAPLNDDPSNCPLCKEILYSGQFVAPAWAVFFLPTLAVSLIETALPAISRSDTASHAWSSRAPPRH